MRLLSMLPLTLLLVACGDKDGGDSGKADADTDTDGATDETDTDGTDTDTDTDTDADTDADTDEDTDTDTSVEAAEWGDLEVIDVSPTSLRVGEGGTIVIKGRLRRRPDLLLQEWDALIDEELVRLTAEAGDGDTITLTGTVDSVEQGFQLAHVSVDGVDVSVAPIRASYAPEDVGPALDPMEGAPRYDGLAQALETNFALLLGSATNVRTGDEDDMDIGVWRTNWGESDDSDITADPVFEFATYGAYEDDDDSFISWEVPEEFRVAGPGDAHFGSITVRSRVSEDGSEDGGDDVVAWLYGGEGLRVKQLRRDRSTGEWGSKDLTTGFEDGGLPSDLRQIQPAILDDAGTVGMTLFGLDEVDTGKWEGFYFDGQKPYSWTELGSTTAQAVGEGRAFAGLLGSGEDPILHKRPGRVVWSFDPGTISAACEAKLGLYQVSSRPIALRTVVLQDERDADDECRTFGDVTAMAVDAIDPDGDGTTDLIVRIWGRDQDGVATHSDHFVPSATDGEATTTSVHLKPIYENPLYTESSASANNALYGLEVDDVLGASDFHLHRNGEFISLQGGAATGARMPTDASSIEGWQRVRNTWKLDELAEAIALSERGPTSLDAVTGGVIGRGTASTARKGGPSGASSTGVCLNGVCVCLPGYGSTLRLGSGPGAEEAGAELTSGDLVELIDLGGGPFVTRTTWGETTAEGLVVAARGWGDRYEELVMGNDGTISVTGGDILFEDHSTLQLLASPGGGLVAAWTFDDSASVDASFAPPPLLADKRRFAAQELSDRKRELSASLPEDTTVGGATPPVFLSDIGDDGGVVLFWRDGEGRAWIGIADVESAWGSTTGELTFLAGPMAMGEADPTIFEQLPISAAMPLAVGARFGSAGDAVLATDDDALDTRFDGWDEPTEVPFGALEPSDAATSTTIMVTLRVRYSDTTAVSDLAELSCPYATVTLPAAAIGSDDWESQALIETGSEPDCSDLPLPLASGDLLGDGSQVIVSALNHQPRATVHSARAKVHHRMLSPSGSSSTGDDGGLLCGGTDHFLVQTGDLDGDLLDDVVFRCLNGSPSHVLLSDGRGGDKLDGDDEGETTLALLAALRHYGPLFGNTPIVDEVAVAGPFLTSVQWPYRLDLAD